MSVASIRQSKSVREQVGPEEWAKRVDLAAAYRLIAWYGLDEMIANHISTRVPGSHEQFLINPYGMLYEQMHASCFIRIDLDGNELFNPTEHRVNRAGFVIHSAIHKARPEVDSVIHTHTIAGMAVSAMKCGILPLAQISMRFGDIAYHDFEGIADDLDERERLVRDLGQSDAMVLRNHGLLACGASIPEAFNNMFRMERACQVQVAALSCNTELSLPSKDVVERTNRQFDPKTPGVRRRGLMEWPALLKRLDALDPSYRD
jgi:ribulose-5-phosphate 4-epimerase/fuculose-1-phosphate aldolase